MEAETSERIPYAEQFARSDPVFDQHVCLLAAFRRCAASGVIEVVGYGGLYVIAIYAVFASEHSGVVRWTLDELLKT